MVYYKVFFNIVVFYREMYMKDFFELGYEHEKSGDYLRAIELYEIAASNGHDEAECRLGSIYRFGRGVKKIMRRHFIGIIVLLIKVILMLCQISVACIDLHKVLRKITI